jgi:hypothetical protein
MVFNDDDDEDDDIPLKRVVATELTFLKEPFLKFHNA